MRVAGDSPGADDDVRSINGLHGAPGLVHSNLHGGIRQPAVDPPDDRDDSGDTYSVTISDPSWAFTLSRTDPDAESSPDFRPPVGYCSLRHFLAAGVVVRPARHLDEPDAQPESQGHERDVPSERQGESGIHELSGLAESLERCNLSMDGRDGQNRHGSIGWPTPSQRGRGDVARDRASTTESPTEPD